MCKAYHHLRAPGCAGSSLGKCHRLLKDEACASKTPRFAVSSPVAEMKSRFMAISLRSRCALPLPGRNRLSAHHVRGLLGAKPDSCCLCLLPQMANPVPSACCMVLAAVVVVYAQRHSQQGESLHTSPTLGVTKNVNAAPLTSLLGQAGCTLWACLILCFWVLSLFSSL